MKTTDKIFKTSAAISPIKTEDIIRKYALHEARESSPVNPEHIPFGLLHTLADRRKVKAYTDKDRTAWLLVSKAERRFLLQAPLE
jgi:hypothetical protein